MNKSRPPRCPGRTFLCSKPLTSKITSQDFLNDLRQGQTVHVAPAYQLSVLKAAAGRFKKNIEFSIPKGDLLRVRRHMENTGAVVAVQVVQRHRRFIDSHDPLPIRQYAAEVVKIHL